jgi:hypothetical protein
MLRDKSPSPQRTRNKPRPTSTHAKATWASEVPFANLIPPFIKPYQAPIPSIPSKFLATRSSIQRPVFLQQQRHLLIFEEEKTYGSQLNGLYMQKF